MTFVKEVPVMVSWCWDNACYSYSLPNKITSLSNYGLLSYLKLNNVKIFENVL